MTVTLRLPEELEFELKARAAAAGQNLESFNQNVVVESLSADGPQREPSSAFEFSQRLDRWIAMHPVLDQAIDDSQDSIDSANRASATRWMEQSGAW